MGSRTRKGGYGDQRKNKGKLMFKTISTRQKVSNHSVYQIKWSKDWQHSTLICVQISTQAPSFKFGKRLCPAGAAGVLCLNIFNKAGASKICTWYFKLNAGFDPRRRGELAGLKLMTRCDCNCFRGTSDESRRETVRKEKGPYLCNYFIYIIWIFTSSCRIGETAVKHPD